jgi:hypothetical protein
VSATTVVNLKGHRDDLASRMWCRILSMDYEVFILTRIREERDKTGSTAAGVVEGIGGSWRIQRSLKAAVD